MCLEPSDWIVLAGVFVQVLIFMGLLQYVQDTKRIADDTLRPVLKKQLICIPAKERLMIQVVNDSRTDAVGMVILRVFINDCACDLATPSYSGRERWNFPAGAAVNGNLHFPADLKEKVVNADPNDKLEFELYVYFKAWSHKKRKISKGAKFYCLPEKWEWSPTAEHWILVLTSGTLRRPPEPDWSVIEGKLQA